MSLLADLLASVLDRPDRGAEGAEFRGRGLEDLAADLLSERGEISGMAMAREILRRFGSLDAEGKAAFFRHITTEMDLSGTDLRAALAAYEDAPTKATYRALMSAAEPQRQEFIRRLNQAPGATAALVGMRDDLLQQMRAAPELAPLDLDFRHLFASWFNRGFLVLLPVNWDTSARVLEKIIAYEAVHTIDSWEDLRRRLEPADRRCFAFFHPAMPGEPLIFVEVALTRGIPGSIADLLAEDREELDPARADTAVFYSISNCQAGLAGISFGNSLIKQVVADLSTDHPGLSTFVTLSPIPGFCRWAEGAEIDLSGLAEERMVETAAQYLLEAKRPDGRPLDPVARFHLGNGAVIHALHAAADPSERGQRQSAGVMVNYLYDLGRISQNHEAYAQDGTIAAASAVRSLARRAQKTDA
ncbi:MAG: malonyl-CoA decarboxylase [Pseudomonadota bacterium]